MSEEVRHDHGKLALVLGALTAFAPLSIDMYLPSLPTIQRELGTTASLTQLTLASFFAGLGLAQLAYGPLADRFGRKPPLYFGLALYVVASLGCALAPSIGILIAMRFLQAVGGAAGLVVARAVVRDLYQGPEAARVLSLLILIMGAAPILAPILGAAILSFASWRLIFGILACFGLACLGFVFAALPETATRRTPRIDVKTIGAGLRALFADRSFVTYTLSGAFGQAGMFAYISGSPFVLIEIFHVSPQRYGWIFGSNAFGLIAASQVNRRLLGRFAPGALLRRATLVTALMGAVLVATALFARGAFLPVLASLFAFVTSLGFIGPNATALAMEEHGSRAGLASAALGSTQFAIAAVASSLVGSLNDGTMRPMAIVMGVCAVFALVFGRLALRSPRPGRTHASS